MINDDFDRIAIESDAKEGEGMLAAVYKFLGRFVAYPSEHAHVAHALWVIHTHLMDKWDSTPRIAFLSAEPASGKTRALEITELLVPNPVMAVNVSPSYLFRKVGAEERATILYDEIDTVFGPKAKENEEIRGLLNAGHRRGAKAGRCAVRGKEIVPEEIHAFSALALAGLGWLPDTILTRSIIIRMRRRHAGETVEPYRQRIHSAEGNHIRALIERWARGATIEWPELPREIQDRDADVWESLIAIADAIGGEWPARARKAAVSLVTDAKEREPSLGIRLLADLKTIFKDADKMLTKVILAALSNIEEAPWRDLRGKQLDERGLAMRLRAYGVKSTLLRLGEAIGRGYQRTDLADAWARYLPPSAATSVAGVTSVTNQPTHVSVTDVTEVTLPSAHGGEEIDPDGWTFNLEN